VANQEQKSVKCRHVEFYERLNESEVDDISISGEYILLFEPHFKVQFLKHFFCKVKLFLNSLDYETVNQSIQTSKSEKIDIKRSVTKFTLSIDSILGLG
jgi:hypothetical protein